MDELEMIRRFESDVHASAAAREAARVKLLRARAEHMKPSVSPRHARFRRRTTRVRLRVGIALAIVAVVTVVPLSALGLVFGGTPTPHPGLQSGPIEISLSPSLGWTAALTSRRLRIAGASRQVSVIIAGDFPLPRPLRPGITPLPPPGRLAIAVRHFSARGISLRWQAVRTIRLPLREQHRFVTIRVRLGSEALLVDVRFGSSPNPERVTLANLFLSGIRNNGE